MNCKCCKAKVRCMARGIPWTGCCAMNRHNTTKTDDGCKEDCCKNCAMKKKCTQQVKKGHAPSWVEEIINEQMD